MNRRVFKVFLFLLLGAILNVAVAWGCAAFSQLKLTSQYPDVLPEFLFQLNPKLNRESQLIQFACVGRGIREDWFVSSPHIPTSSDTSEGWYVLLANTSNGRRIVRVNDLMNSNLAPIRDSSVDVLFLTRASAGWPFTSMQGHAYSTFERDSSSPLGRQNVRSIHSYGHLSLSQSCRTLPLSPAWPGFAINTIFYAAILWLPFAALGAIRRRRRIKRGLCARCGYPVSASGSAVCSECGTAVHGAAAPCNPCRKLPTAESPQ